MVQALKDPMGANLDRVQIVKGWLKDNGETAERVYDVALSDGRQVDAQTGKAPPVGSTVDVATATYRNSIGAAALQTVWRDPDFDPAQAAFYYVSGAGDSNAALDGVRRRVFQNPPATGGSPHHPGARLQFADLVRTLTAMDAGWLYNVAANL